MGAVAALLYADRDPCIGGMVLDSPFVSLKQLAEEEINKRASIPGFIKSAAIEFVRKSILKLAKFDVNDLNTLEHVINTFVPALFCCGKDDTFVSSSHSLQLYEAYPGDKKLTFTEGGHRSIRPKYFLDSVAIFFYNTLLCEQILIDINYQEPNNKSDDSFELL
jgi:Serine hydrolase (FSH1).